jgi:hypothetical protein
MPSDRFIPPLTRCEQIARDAGLAGLAAAARAGRERLDQPMRVAVAGQIKRGKSTLVNALLGEEIAPTAQLEATFTVSEFHDAARRSVVVHYKDPQRPALPVELAQFRRYTVRDPAHAALLRGVRRVCYGLPQPLLRSFRLVDTPGLCSVHRADAANTEALLGIGSLDLAERARMAQTLADLGRTAEELHGDSAEELHRADAVVYLFDRAVNERDLDAVAGFLGPLSATMTALKAFGVLSRCDETYWPPGPDQPGDPDPLTWDPLAVAGRIVDGYLARPQSRRMFYTVLPVAGLVGVAAQTLDEEHFGWLDELGRVEPPRLAMALQDAGYFGTAAAPGGVALPAEHRATLIRRLGAWGCLRAAGYLRDGLGVEKVREHLVIDSGVARLRDTIRSHFGNRSALIKLDHGLSGISNEVARVRLDAQRTGAAASRAVDTIADEVADLRRREHGFAEFATLSALYNGELSGFSAAEVDQLVAVTGEHGVGLASRLGLAADSPVAELADQAERLVDAWALRVQDPLLNRRTRTAARVVLRSHERLADRIRVARGLLETSDDPVVAP